MTLEIDAIDDDDFPSDEEIEAEAEAMAAIAANDDVAQQWFRLFHDVAGTRVPPAGSRDEGGSERIRDEVPAIIKQEEDLMLVSVLRAMRRIADAVFPEDDMLSLPAIYQAKGGDGA